jgi:hypothetical protein
MIVALRPMLAVTAGLTVTGGPTAFRTAGKTAGATARVALTGA